VTHIIFFDDDKWTALLPLTFLKPACELRVGIRTISKKWTSYFDDCTSAYITRDFLAKRYPLSLNRENLLINGRLLPNPNIISLIRRLRPNQGLVYNDLFLAGILSSSQFDEETYDIDLSEIEMIDISSYDAKDIQFIDRPHHIVQQNEHEIEVDYLAITKGRTSQPLNATNRYFGLERIFIEPGAKVDFSILNATDGPIYIGANAVVLENSVLKGPLSIGENSVVKVGAKLYQGTSLGPHCKVGGEVKNVVFQAYSNKAHDGYLGDSVIGEWCNLGADTNCSNLKNNYSEVNLWNYETSEYEPTGMQFFGVVMGDFCKTSINTMLNTGSVIGVSANIFGSGFPKKFVPSFSWGGGDSTVTYTYEKALDAINRAMQRRGKRLETVDLDILEHIFDGTKNRRFWESTI
jgi:UDP-N-acetylglucosamine diphosphorylase/glucosamine-1-phosphate N-acetyltransferase